MAMHAVTCRMTAEYGISYVLHATVDLQVCDLPSAFVFLSQDHSLRPHHYQYHCDMYRVLCHQPSFLQHRDVFSSLLCLRDCVSGDKQWKVTFDIRLFEHHADAMWFFLRRRLRQPKSNRRCRFHRQSTKNKQTPKNEERLQTYD